MNNKSVPYVFMRTERGYRTDMEFSTTTVEKDIEGINRRNNG